MAKTRRIAIASDYQQTREQRIKQNRDRFQKLGIVDLCLKLKPKRTPKPFKSPSLGPTQPSRRSSRLQNPPPVSKRSRDIVLEEGANPEFYNAEHDRLAVKKSSATEGMPAKDPNRPKRPSSAFFFFMEDFRVQYQQKHPNIKLLAIVMKAAGEKWRSMSDAEKAPYVEKLEKRKSDYEKNMSAYKKRRAEGPPDEQKDESDKSRSEVNDEDDNDDSGKAECPQDERKDESDKSWSEVNEDDDDDDDSGKEKAPCIQKVEKRKADYEKNMSAYKKGLAEGHGGHHYQRHGWLPFPPPFLETNTAALEYEQIREQRIKQNHERFKELGIVDLSLQLKPRRTPKPSNHKITPCLGPTQPRRQSFRLQNPPPVPKRSRDIVLEEGTKPAEDPNKPKRPLSAFFVFLEDFRVQYQQIHPDNKSVAAAGKAGGVKWRSMSDAEKVPYVEEVEKRKADYERIMSAYKKRLAEGSQDEREDEADKSTSEVNDEDVDYNSGKVCKASGEKWRSMSDAETAPCIEKEEKRKAELQNGPPDSPVKPKKDKTKRSSDIMLEEGAKPEFDIEKHDKLLGNTEIPSIFSMNRLSVKKGAAKKGRTAKHRKKPKRPPSAFFVFMEDFRVQYKQKHPDNKSIATFAKAAGEKWKSMSDAEKAPYVEEVEKRKADYEKNMSAYKKRRDEGSQDEREDEADKSKSEVNDEEVDYNSGKVWKAGGEKWRSMSDAEKAPYIEKAEERKAELQNGPPVLPVKPKEDKAKRSRDIMLEEGAKPEFDIEEHDKLLGTTEIPSIFSVNRLSVKKGAPKKRTAKHRKKPKRPPGAFFVFMEDFRVQHKQKHPDNKSIATFAKAAGEKWKSMSDAEKAPYVEEVKKRKADYEKNMRAYKKRRAEESQDEREDESDKSGSEVNDVDDDDDSGKEVENDD